MRRVSSVSTRARCRWIRRRLRSRAKVQFKTAADVAGFVVKNMPPGAGGSLKEHEYWSILAFDLHANGVDLPKKIDGSNAKDVVLHK